MRVVVRGEGLAAAIELLRPILVELSEAHVEGTGRWREGGEGGIRSCRWGVAMMSAAAKHLHDFTSVVLIGCGHGLGERLGAQVSQVAGHHWRKRNLHQHVPHVSEGMADENAAQPHGTDEGGIAVQACI